MLSPGDRQGGGRGAGAPPRAQHRARSGDDRQFRRQPAGRRSGRGAAQPAHSARTAGDAQSAGGRRAVGASLARNEREMEAQAREILALGARNVLIKGGHGAGEESVDLLIGQGEVVRLSAKRIATKNTHGTGCTLSSAIAAGLAKGRDLDRRRRKAPKLTSPRPSPPPTHCRSATARAAASFLCQGA